MLATSIALRPSRSSLVTIKRSSVSSLFRSHMKLRRCSNDELPDTVSEITRRVSAVYSAALISTIWFLVGWSAVGRGRRRKCALERFYTYIYICDRFSISMNDLEGIQSPKV